MVGCVTQQKLTRDGLLLEVMYFPVTLSMRCWGGRYICAELVALSRYRDVLVA